MGHLGKEHARIYSHIKEVELVALCDIDIERVKKLSSFYNADWSSEYHNLIGRVDAVSIVVPTNGHYKIAKDFLKQGVAVLLEKPMTEKVSEAEDLIRLSEEKNLLQVGHVERFNPAVRELKKRLKKPRFLEIHRLGPYKGRGIEVGVTLDLMLHDLDILFYLLSSPLKEISAIGVPVFSSDEDIVNARLTFEDGAIANLTASRISDKEMRKIRVFEKNKYFSLDYLNQEIIIYERLPVNLWKGKERPKISELVRKKEIPIKKEEPLRLEIASFVESAMKKERPLVSGEEGKKALEVALAIAKKIKKR